MHAPQRAGGNRPRFRKDSTISEGAGGSAGMPAERSPNGTVDHLPRGLPHEALESSSQIKWIGSIRRVQTEILRFTGDCGNDSGGLAPLSARAHSSNAPMAHMSAAQKTACSSGLRSTSREKELGDRC